MHARTWTYKFFLDRKFQSKEVVCNGDFIFRVDMFGCIQLFPHPTIHVPTYSYAYLFDLFATMESLSNLILIAGL